MLDKDMVNILSHLYFSGRIADAATRTVLHCYYDTVAPLRQYEVVAVANDCGVNLPQMPKGVEHSHSHAGQYGGLQ